MINVLLTIYDVLLGGLWYQMNGLTIIQLLGQHERYRKAKSVHEVACGKETSGNPRQCHLRLIEDSPTLLLERSTEISDTRPFLIRFTSMSPDTLRSLSH